MTVGIAAACETNSTDPKVVVAADRMVTSGAITKIEYEHPQTKLEEVYSDGGIHCVAVSSGDTSLSDDFYHRLTQKLDDSDPYGIEQIVQRGVDCYQEIIKENANRAVLQPLDLTLSDIHSEEVDLDPGTEQALVNDVLEQQDQVRKNLNVMIAGIDGMGTHLSSIPNGDIARHDSIGYHAIGSGSQPARSSFIRSEYDATCVINDALLSVVEAKTQSEPAQGVGKKMDITVIDGGGCYEFDQNEIDEVSEYFDSIVESEIEAREKVIDDSDYSFDWERR